MGNGAEYLLIHKYINGKKEISTYSPYARLATSLNLQTF